MAGSTTYLALGLIPNDTAQADPAATTTYFSIGLVANEYNTPVPPVPPPTPEEEKAYYLAYKSSLANLGSGMGL